MSHEADFQFTGYVNNQNQIISSAINDLYTRGVTDHTTAFLALTSLGHVPTSAKGAAVSDI
jgi:hypothetical protein